MEEIRIKIIKEILDTFGVYNYSVTCSLERGESLADFLRANAVIYPQEYKSFLDSKTSNFGEFADSLSFITTTIRNKQKIYELYERYCRYFLGERVLKSDLSDIPSDVYVFLNLRDENGYINYTPYLAALGIDNINEISSQYKGR